MSLTTCPDSDEFARAVAVPTMPGWAAGGPAATRFFASPEGPGRAVSVQVANRQMQIRSEDGTVAADWPLNAVRSAAAPAGAVRFRFGSERLVVADAYMLEVLRHHVRGWPGQRRRWRLATAAGALALGAGLLAPAAWPDQLKALVPAWPLAPMAAVAPEAALPGRRCGTEEGQRAIDGLVTRIARTPSLVAVVDDASVNAAGVPARFAVTRGMIAAAADGDELAGLLAWQLGGGAQAVPAAQPGRPAPDDPAAALLRAAGMRRDGLARFVERTRTQGAMPEFLSGYPARAGARAGGAGQGASAATPAEWKAIRSMCAAG